jgi:hypothetical protein
MKLLVIDFFATTASAPSNMTLVAVICSVT